NNSPFLYTDGKFVDLGRLNGAATATALALNRRGVVVGAAGYSEDCTQCHAFLWDGELVDLAPAFQFSASVASSINEHGVVVGRAHDSKAGRDFAVRFAKSKVVELENEVPELNGWQLLNATSINDDGAIVGEGMKQGVAHSY